MLSYDNITKEASWVSLAGLQSPLAAVEVPLAAVEVLAG
jgi:hypothetical protein